MKLHEHLASMYETQQSRFRLYYRVLSEEKKAEFRRYLNNTRPWLSDSRSPMPISIA